MKTSWLGDCDPKVVCAVGAAEFFFRQCLVVDLWFVGLGGVSEEQEGEFVGPGGVDAERVIIGPLRFPGFFDIESLMC